MILTIENQTDFTIPQAKLEEIGSPLTHREVELIIIDNSAIQDLNKEHRGKDSPTDVLSFPLEGEFEGMPLGSIVISLDFVALASGQLGHSMEDEFALLFIHGLLHLLGFDHECDNGEMRDEEERLIALHGLPQSLIVRTT